MKNIFYKGYTPKWQRILTIVHLVFAAVFTIWIILTKVYKYSFGSVLITAIILAIGLTVLKFIAIKKKA
jgi:hypothetical protein